MELLTAAGPDLLIDDCASGCERVTARAIQTVLSHHSPYIVRDEIAIREAEQLAEILDAQGFWIVAKDGHCNGSCKDGEVKDVGNNPASQGHSGQSRIR